MTVDTTSTNARERPAPRGWVLYDGDCRLCVDLAGRFRPLLTRHGFAVLPLQSDEGRALAAGRADADRPTEMAVVTRERKVFGGAEAILYLAGQFRWSRPLRALVMLPGGRRLADAGYRWIAANRHCYRGACERPRARNPLVLFTGAIALPLAAVAGTWTAEPWIAMWVIAFSLFFACKLLTLYREPVRRGLFGIPLGYLFLWPGMDPKPFVIQQAARGFGVLKDEKLLYLSQVTRNAPRKDSSRYQREFGTQDVSATLGLKQRPVRRTTGIRQVRRLSAALHITAGAALIWGAVPAAGAHSPYAAAWIGMTGIVLLLHFGVFHLLALVWQARGVPVRPLMRAPLLATSLSDFWGGRWNLAFSDLARDFVYRPLWRKLGPARCTLLVFLISGLVHDFVISFPARGGWGLPTLYFLAQGCGILIERSTAGRRAGLGRGMRGRLFTLSVLALPLPGLFHPPFIQNVVIPFLESIQIQ